jgi:DNA-binding response OmpR family regulator
MGKAFHYPELIARIDAVLRRTSGRRERGMLQVVSFGSTLSRARSRWTVGRSSA